MLKRIKKRRNPSEEEDLRERRLKAYKNLSSKIFNTIIMGNPDDLVDSIILYKQGEICIDCYNEDLGEKPKKYNECICEKCGICNFRRDLCYLDIDYKGPIAEDYTKEERKRVREACYELILEILADDLYNDGKKYNIIPDLSFKNLNELKKDFLNNALQKDNIDLSHAELYNIDLSKLNLSESDLSKTTLVNANLSGSNLSGTDLSKANLSGANLSGANLSGANLSGANLSGTDLSQTDLSEADLSETSLFNTNFTNAIVYNTIFTKAINMKYSIGLEINNPITKSLRKKKYGNRK